MLDKLLAEVVNKVGVHLVDHRQAPEESQFESAFGQHGLKQAGAGQENVVANASHTIDEAGWIGGNLRRFADSLSTADFVERTE